MDTSPRDEKFKMDMVKVIDSVNKSSDITCSLREYIKVYPKESPMKSYCWAVSYLICLSLILYIFFFKPGHTLEMLNT